jgi:hypothetical protein
MNLEKYYPFLENQVYTFWKYVLVLLQNSWWKKNISKFKSNVSLLSEISIYTTKEKTSSWNHYAAKENNGPISHKEDNFNRAILESINWLWWGKSISFGCKENFKLVQYTTKV